MTTALFSALADESRRSVLELLKERGPMSVGELASASNTSQPSTSKHLRVLREAGLVTTTVDGKRRIYALAPGPLAELDSWLQPYRVMWNAALDRLGRQLNEPSTDDSHRRKGM